MKLTWAIDNLFVPIATIVILILLVLAFFTDPCHAQDKPSFWTTERKFEVPLFLAATGADAYFTNHNLAAGGTEHNPWTRVFTHTTGQRVGYYSGLAAVTVVGSYWLDRRGHHRAADWLLRIQLGSETGFAAYSGVHQ